MIGKTLGNYQVIEKIGAGGMGEVYRARDTRLNRDVALKVLPPAFANDPERMARFQREAQMLALLNHSNIAAIYGLEESDGLIRPSSRAHRKSTSGRPRQTRAARAAVLAPAGPVAGASSSTAR